MNMQSYYLVSSLLCWFIVVFGLVGYFLIVRRLKQKWLFWLTLIVGWTLLAVANSISALGLGRGTFYPSAIWLSSYVMVIASIVLLFLKLIKVMGTVKRLPKHSEGNLPTIGQGGFENKM